MPTLADTTVLDAFRRWGYPEAEAARRIYAGSLGVEFMHIADPAVREWVAQQMEAPAPQPDRRRILERLLRAEAFEQMLQSRYLGSKRFSIEGLATLVPLLDEVVATLASHGCEMVVLAMSHRGRLTVMATVVGKDPGEILAGFEDVDPRSVLFVSFSSKAQLRCPHRLKLYVPRVCPEKIKGLANRL